MNNRHPATTHYASGDWDHESLDLDAYLRRIAYSGPLHPDLETLRGLQRAHLNAIVFENLDVILGEGIRIDLASIQDKLVHQQRGGYCHEHNTLFATVLERLGFNVTGHSARMLMGNDESVLSAIGHTMLTVRLDGRDWLVDVGVGNTGPRQPIALSDGQSVLHDAWQYRLERTPQQRWVLRYRRHEGWFNLYQFSSEPYYRADFEQHNYHVSTHPNSPFTRRIIAQYNGAQVRYALTDRELKIFKPEQPPQIQQLAPEGIAEVLRDLFRLSLTPSQHEQLRDRARANQSAAGAAEQLGN